MEHLYDCTLGLKATAVLRANDLKMVIDHIEHLGEKTLWVCDSTTRTFLGDALDNVVVLPPGEAAKGWDSVQAILLEAKQSGMARDGRFIAFGGGVVCDMTAFAASVYMRGCSVSLVPTTLLAMVDASLGGKTAIDLFGAKNLVGTFYPADEVLLCSQTLASLSEKEYKNGLGEVLKHALLAQDTSLLDFLEKNQWEILARTHSITNRMIEMSLNVKRSYIERDPKEQKGIRDALNLGHTFAHALESVGNLCTWSHGEAVAWGVVHALRAGTELRITDEKFAQRYERLFTSYGFDTGYRVTDFPAYFAALSADKKKRGGAVRFVIMTGQGTYELIALDSDHIRQLVV
jgi:3-dehydroquinate synthase